MLVRALVATWVGLLAALRGRWLVGPCAYARLARRADSFVTARIRDERLTAIIYRIVHDESPSYDTIIRLAHLTNICDTIYDSDARSYRILCFSELIPEKLLNEFSIHLIR